MYGRCDPCSEREPGTGRLRREQAPVPCTPAMASDHRQSREHATTQRPGPHEDPLTASSGRPSEERVTGHQEGSRGLISPSRRMFSTAPVNQEDDGRPGYPKRSRRPSAICCVDDGVTLRPPPVCTGRGGRLSTQGVGTAYTPCSPVFLHAPCLGASSMASCLSPTWQCVKWTKVACKRSTNSREMQSGRRTFPSTPMRSHGSRDRSRRCVAALLCQESRQDRG